MFLVDVLRCFVHSFWCSVLSRCLCAHSRFGSLSMWSMLLHMYILLRVRRVTCMITGILNVYSFWFGLLSKRYRNKSAYVAMISTVICSTEHCGQDEDDTNEPNIDCVQRNTTLNPKNSGKNLIVQVYPKWSIRRQFIW